MRRIATIGFVLSLFTIACGSGTESSREADKKSPGGTIAPADAGDDAGSPPGNGDSTPQQAKERQIDSLPAYREVTIPKGTGLSFRLLTPVASDSNAAEDPVRATLRRAVTVDGVQALPAGTLVNGVVTSAKRSARVKGRASVAFRFTSVTVDDEPVPMRTTSIRRVARATKGKDAKTIGIPATGGAVVGAVLGGKKGAVIGGATGGGAGTAVVLSTRGQEVRLAAGTIVNARLAEALVLRIPVRAEGSKGEDVEK